MKKVLITSRSFGKNGSEPFSILDNADILYTQLGTDFSYEKFCDIVADYDALIMGGHKFDDIDMDRCKNLKIIAKYGAGLDNINLPKAKELGITVTNTPATNSNAVADLTFAHILNCSRGVVFASNAVKNGEWKPVTGKEVYAKTLGIVGFGNIAKNVAKRAGGFSMKVLAYDPFVKEVPDELKSYTTLCELDLLVAQSDIISINSPLTDQTKGLFDKSVIMKMKKDAILINAGRGGIINESDLYDCMKEGHLFACGLDVCENEPIERDSPLLALDNVIITPHMGMYSIEALNAVGVICAQNVVKKLTGGSPEFVVSG